MTAHQLLKAFRLCFDTSPAQFVIEQRLRRARWLLTCTNHDVAQIALEAAKDMALKAITIPDDLRKYLMSFDFLSCENELVIDVEQHKQAADDERPLRQHPRIRARSIAPRLFFDAGAGLNQDSLLSG